MIKKVYIYDNGIDTLCLDDKSIAQMGITVDAIKKSVTGTSAKFSEHEIKLARPTYRCHKEVERLCSTPDPETGLMRQDESKRLQALITVLVEDWDLPYDKNDADSLPISVAAFLIQYLPGYLYGGQSLDENDPFGRLLIDSSGS